MADLINPLVAQYLAGLGADLMKYGGDTSKGLQLENVNAITNQSIKANSMKKLMSTILGDNDSKMTFGKDGATIKIPSNMLLEEGETAGGGTSALNTDTNVATMAAPSQAPVQTQAQPQTPAQPAAVSEMPVAPVRVNPFTNIGAADLAGIDSQTMIGLANMLHNKQQLDQMSYRDAVNTFTDVPYKKALTKQAEAAAAENTPSVTITVGDKTMKVTPKDAIAWEKLKKETTPNEIKLYEYAQKHGFTGSIVDFKNADLTVHQKDYNAAVKDGYKGNFNSWLLEQAKAGAINLGTKIEEKKAMSELAGQLYFNDPKWVDDIGKKVSDFEKDQAWLIPEKDRPLAKSRLIVKSIEDKITAGSGKIQSVVMDEDGKTMVWTVNWPSGDTKVIRQAVK